MPPRAAKKTAAAPGPKRKAKVSPKLAAAAKAAEVAEVAAAAAVAEDAEAMEAAAATEAAKAIETAAAATEVGEAVETVEAAAAEVKEEIKVEQPTSEVTTEDTEAKKDVKESFEEDKEERLELEDQEQEYDPEEETAVDYDGQEEEVSEGEEVGEEGDEGENEGEGDEIIDQDLEVGGEGKEDGGGDGEDVEGEEEENEVDLEEEEHHEGFKEHRKRKEFEVFVGGLDKDVTEADLKKVFSEVGEVTDVRLMMNPLTKKNRGFAFLRFATVEQAKRAVSDFKHPVVNGKQCGVNPIQDSDTLFVGNICKTWTKEYLKETLKNYGVENIEDLTLVEDTSNEGMNRGFAFLEFSSRSEALNAYRCLRKRDVILGTDRIAKVSLADSFIEPDDEVMVQVKTVFVDGLPSSWDEDRVKECLKKYGVIEKVELARNMPSARRKDFGFVTFDTHDNAVACSGDINSVGLSEGINKVKVRARLSRPRQRGRGRHGTQGSFGIDRGDLRGGRGSYGRPLPSRFPARVSRVMRGRGPPIRARGFRSSIGFRDRPPVAALDERPRRLPLAERPYVRRPPMPAYPKSSYKREYLRRDMPPPRSRAIADYGSSIPIERDPYREDYPSRRSGYSDIATRSDPHTANRRAYDDEGYRETHERPLPSYQGNSREYGPISRSKRPYSELDDAPRYSNVNTRQSRARLDYGATGSSTHYNDTYADRLERYSSRRSLSDQDGLYKSRQGMNYSEGSLSGTGGSGIYPSSLSSSYASHGSNDGGSSYTSLYSGRSMGGSGYLGSSGSGSYY